MNITQQQLKKVQVETQSGQLLGQVVDFELDVDTGVVVRYHVKSKVALAGLFENKLIINREQIIDFDDKKMIVDDNVAKELKTKKKLVERQEDFKGTEPAITSGNNQ